MWHTGVLPRAKTAVHCGSVTVIGDLGLIKLGMQCLVNIADLIFALYIGESSSSFIAEIVNKIGSLEFDVMVFVGPEPSKSHGRRGV